MSTDDARHDGDCSSHLGGGCDCRVRETVFDPPRPVRVSTDELRTAAIEAGLASPWAFHSNPELAVASVVDAILPLLVAGTASRIADAIEAERQKMPYTIESWAEGRRYAFDECVAIARRVGGTS